MEDSSIFMVIALYSPRTERLERMAWPKCEASVWCCSKNLVEFWNSSQKEEGKKAEARLAGGTAQKRDSVTRLPGSTGMSYLPKMITDIEIRPRC